MAVDVCSEVSSLAVSPSPRISFSHDLKESCDRITPVPEPPHPLISTIDFDFCCITADQIFPSADELFADGKILPIELKKPTPVLNADFHTKRQMLKELLSANPEEEKPPAKPPFWQFKRRSCSLNSENGLIRSLQFLSRSNSTGSAQNHRPSVLPKHIQRQNSKKEPPLGTRSSNIHTHPLSCSSKNSSSNSSSSSLKKSRSSSGRSYASFKISPVLNIPPAYISKAAFFALTSFFCSGKSKKKKK